MSQARVRLAARDDFRAWRESMQSMQSTNGEPWFFSPRSRDDVRPPLDLDEIEDHVERMRSPTTSARWPLRVWLAEAEGGAIAGSAQLQGGELPSALHRCTLGMGVSPGHQRRGVGRALLEAAIGFAQREPALAYLDLNVFEENEPALSLYRSLGFREIARTPDRFRLEGRALTDILMTLRVG